MAERCLADDADVIVVGTESGSVDAVCDELGPRAHPVTGDVRTRQGCAAIVSTALAASGKIDVLVNNAGVYPRAALLDIDDEQWEADVSVNIRGVSHMTALVGRHLIARGSPGHIVNVASVDAFLAWPDNAHYAATKAAVVSLTKSFALELAPRRILVNAVAPSAMATERARQAGWLDGLAAQIPLGRAADPAEVADVIHYLGSSRTTFVTGETIAVAGGFLFR